MNQPTARTGVASAFAALDQGAYGPAIALYEEGACPLDGVAGAIWRAEVAAYLFRLGEAEAALAEADDVDDTLYARRELVAAEIDLLACRYENLESRFRFAADEAKRVGDRTTEARAIVDVARLRRMRGEWGAAVEAAVEGQDLASSAASDYLRGVGLFNEAAARFELGELELASDRYQQAIDLLRVTENLRVRALAESGFAGALVGAGRPDEAVAFVESAERTMLGLGSIGDAQIVRITRGYVEFAAGRFDRARLVAAEIVGSARATADERSEFFGLRLLASVACAAGDLDAADEASQEVLRLASSSATPEFAIDGRLLGARARAKGGNLEAFAELDLVIEEIEASGDRVLVAIALACKADALLGVDVARAYRAHHVALAAAGRLRGGWLSAELAALKRAWERQPVRFEENRLVIDVSGKLPDLESARSIVEWQLSRTALARTNGNFAAAGRELEISRWHMWHLSQTLDETLARPPVPTQKGRDKRKRFSRARRVQNPKRARS